MKEVWPGSVSGENPSTLRRLAEQCRRLARGASTADVATSLKEIASNYEDLAARAEASEIPPGTSRRR